MTFVSPFTYIGNGFFGAWTGVLAACALCHAHVPLANSWINQVLAVGKGSPATVLAGLAVSSTLVWVEAAVALANGASHMEIWALVLGLLSSVLVIGRLLAGPPLEKLDRYISAALGLWWVQGLALSFVRDWVTSTVNGYVALWASLLLAAKVSLGALSPQDGVMAVPQQEVADA